MSDDRLFASNHAIGRKWYYINLVILAIITVITESVFKNYITPNAIDDFYVSFSNILMYFLYLIYLITFFALIDRRLYDLSGSRDSIIYKRVSDVLKLIVFYQILVIAIPYLKLTVSLPINLMQQIAVFLSFIFIIITFIIGLFPGQISNLSYEEYKKRIQYKL